jgi:hypothetical protein
MLRVLVISCADNDIVEGLAANERTPARKRVKRINAKTCDTVDIVRRCMPHGAQHLNKLMWRA